MFVYITAPSRDEALSLGKALVTERLAACANIIPAMESVYWWQGRVEQGAESALILKTINDLLLKLNARVKQLHSYDTPCIVAWPLAHVDADFAAWLSVQLEENKEEAQ